MSSNIFALLDDFDDEPKKVAPKAAAPKKAAAPAPAPAPAASAAASASAPAPAPAAAKAEKAAKPKADKPKGEKKTDSRPPRSDNKPREAKKPATPVAAEGDAEFPKDDSRAPRHYRDRRDGNKGRVAKARSNELAAAGVGATKAHREKDRQNSSGRSHAPRKGGRGPGGVGNDQQDAQEAEKNPEAVINPEPETEAAAAEETPATEEVAAPAEPAAPPVLTLDEYLAKRKQSRSNKKIFGATKTRAVEQDLSGLTIAEDEKITFVGGVPVTKVTKQSKKNTQRAIVKNTILDVGFKTAPTQEFDGERPGRGERRGGDRQAAAGGSRGEKGPGRSPRPTAGAKFDINDSANFPSL